MKPIVTGSLLAFVCAGCFAAGAQSSASPDPARMQQEARLLVLFPAGTERPSDAVLLKNLKSLPRTGWLIDVERVDGSLTGFVSRDALAGALAQTVPGEDSHSELDAAIQQLLADTQNSALLFASKVPLGFQKPEWTDALVRNHVPIYFVDGGWRRLVTYDMSWGYPISGSGLGPDTALKKARYGNGGVMHELNLKAAVKDIVKDRKGGYAVFFAQPK